MNWNKTKIFITKQKNIIQYMVYSNIIVMINLRPTVILST